MPEIVNQHIHNWHETMILKSISYEDNFSILDIGCGYGRLSLPIISRYPNIKICGIDISENFIKLYKQNTGHNAQLLQLEQISQIKEKFDLIFCVTVLMYIEKDSVQPVIKSMIDLLKPGGKLLIIENDKNGQFFQNPFNIRNLFGNETKRSAINTGGISFKRKDLIDWINFSGGTIIKQKGIPFTTLLILPLCLIVKVLPKSLSKLILKLLSKCDTIFEQSQLPSFSLFFKIEKKS